MDIGTEEKGNDQQLEHFAKTVEEYCVSGMVQGDTQIGKDVYAKGGKDLGRWGTDIFLLGSYDRESRTPSTRKFYDFLREASSTSNPELRRVTRKTHFVAILEPDKKKNPEKKEGKKVFAYGFLVDPRPLDVRDGYHGVVGALMDEEEAKQLIETIKKNPDFLEKFFQRVFSGLDYDAQKKTGMKRVKADGFLVLDDDFLDKFPRKYTPIPKSIHDLEYYTFSKPVGFSSIS